MKALLLTDRMENGGAETHIAMLARGLLARGMEVAVLSSGGRMADRLEEDGVPQFRMAPVGRSPIAILRARNAVRTLAERERFDILHAHARIPALFLRGCEGRDRCAPLPIVTVHAAFRSSPLLARICYWGERTIAVSEDLRAYACDRFGVPAERITVIPNGIDCKAFSPDGRTPVSPHSVLFASRLDADCAWGAELLCTLAPRLAERYPDLRITVAGGGNRFEDIRRRAEAANRAIRELSKRSAYAKTEEEQPVVQAVGTVADMASLYRRHRVFVGVSRAAMEAAACGCAVLLCGNEGYAGLLSPRTPRPSLSNFCARGYPKPSAERLEADLLRLLSSEEHCAEAALEGRAWMLREFDADRMVERTLRVYGGKG